MDFQSALETFAEAWVAASAQTALTSDIQNFKQQPGTDRSVPWTAVMGENNTSDNPSCPSSRGLTAVCSPALAVKLLPIRCCIEKVVAGRRTDAHLTSPVENYAIVPGSTLFCDIVQAAMIKLGYNTREALSAQGSLQFKNWKPLPIDGITDNANATVEDILGDLTSLTTLKIIITSNGPTDDLREKLLHLLLKQSHDLLRTTGCPITQEVVEQIVTGNGDAPPDVRASFYKWYQEHAPDDLHPKCIQPLAPFASCPIPRVPSTFIGVPNGKSRLRICFDPDLELPKLNIWFHASRHPSRQQMVKYLDELNSQPRRLNSKPLDLTNIMYWFKNARAAQRRMRRGGRVGSAQEGSCPDNEDADDADESEDEEPRRRQHRREAPLDQLASALFPGNGLPASAATVRSSPTTANDELVVGNANTLPTANSLACCSSTCETACDSVQSLGPMIADAASTSEDERTDQDDEDTSIGIADEKVEAEDLTMPKTPKMSIRAEGCSAGSGDYLASIPAAPSANALRMVDIKQESDSDVSKLSESSSAGTSSPPASMYNIVSVHGAAAAAPGEYAFGYGNFPMPYANSPAAMHPFYDIGKSHFSVKQKNGERQKRHRAFIDPVSEIPKLEQWFGGDTHPSHYVIEQICDELNKGEFRSRYPKLTSKNIQLWFKNHRAKVKRLRLSQSHPDLCSLTSGISQTTY